MASCTAKKRQWLFYTPSKHATNLNIVPGVCFDIIYTKYLWKKEILTFA